MVSRRSHRRIPRNVECRRSSLPHASHTRLVRPRSVISIRPDPSVLGNSTRFGCVAQKSRVWPQVLRNAGASATSMELWRARRRSCRNGYEIRPLLPHRRTCTEERSVVPGTCLQARCRARQAPWSGAISRRRQNRRWLSFQPEHCCAAKKYTATATASHSNTSNTRARPPRAPPRPPRAMLCTPPRIFPKAPPEAPPSAAV